MRICDYNEDKHNGEVNRVTLNGTKDIHFKFTSSILRRFRIYRLPLNLMLSIAISPRFPPTVPRSSILKVVKVLGIGTLLNVQELPEIIWYCVRWD